MMNSQIEIALPTDDELELLADYLSGSMSSAERETFRHRLGSDAEFFYRMAPIMDIWYSRDPVTVAKTTPTGVTLRLHVQPATLTRYSQFAAAASVIFGALLYNPVATTVLQRVAFGPEPASIPFVHHPRQPRVVAPAPVAVRVATAPKTPRRVALPPVVNVAELPVMPVAADSAIAIDSLPAIAAGMAARIDDSVEFRSNTQVVVQWARSDGSVGRGIDLGGIARAFADKLGAFFTWVRHPRTHKLGQQSSQTDF
jgi:hypothetical protein